MIVRGVPLNRHAVDTDTLGMDTADRFRFPYAGLPARQQWKRAVASVPRSAIDPGGVARARLAPGARIASAGSCFAERIAERLDASSYAYVRTERPSRYSARYGEVYTTVQLAQLAERAVGLFEPAEPAWHAGGRVFDPFRPRVEPEGYADEAAMLADRARHLASVRELFATADVFIVTLGLTEAWVSRTDGAAFPLCPGAGVGRFDAEAYAFRNFDVTENIEALERFRAILRSVNPAARIILTVSPVPLAATYEDRHIVQSVVYSKSVLRVAAETMRRRYDDVDYFAAYEIAATGFDGEDHYGADRRDVTPATVDRIMASFFATFGTESVGATGDAPATALPEVPFSLDLVMAGSGGGSGGADDPCLEGYLERFIESQA